MPLAAMIGIIAAATMTVGNLAAISQSNVKRMLAYSSIAHAGYILMGFVVLSGAALHAVIFYLVIYFFMNMARFSSCRSCVTAPAVSCCMTSAVSVSARRSWPSPWRCFFCR